MPRTRKGRPNRALHRPRNPHPSSAPGGKRLTEGLSRTSSTIGAGITGIFTKRKLDAQTLEELEDVLVQADLGRRGGDAHHREYR